MKIIEVLKSRNFWAIIAFAIGISMRAAGHEMTDGDVQLVSDELYNIASSVFILLGALGVDPKIATGFIKRGKK